jgi:hypothetical protein
LGFARLDGGEGECSASHLIAAAGDLIEALTLGWTAALEVIVTLATRLSRHPHEAMELLSSLLAPNVAAVLLLGLPI